MDPKEFSIALATLDMEMVPNPRAVPDALYDRRTHRFLGPLATIMQEGSYEQRAMMRTHLRTIGATPLLQVTFQKTAFLDVLLHRVEKAAA